MSSAFARTRPIMLRRAILRWMVLGSTVLPVRLALPLWRAVASRLPIGKALRVAADVTEAFELGNETASFYSAGRPRWNRHSVLRTNPRCIFARQFALTGCYDHTLTRELLRSDARGLLVDIGAHYGYFSALWLSCRPDNRVVSIEPVPETYELLEVNLRPFGDRARTLRLCVGDGERQVRMAYDANWPPER